MTILELKHNNQTYLAEFQTPGDCLGWLNFCGVVKVNSIQDFPWIELFKKGETWLSIKIVDIPRTSTTTEHGVIEQIFQSIS